MDSTPYTFSGGNTLFKQCSLRTPFSSNSLNAACARLRLRMAYQPVVCMSLATWLHFNREGLHNGSGHSTVHCRMTSTLF